MPPTNPSARHPEIYTADVPLNQVGQPKVLAGFKELAEHVGPELLETDGNPDDLFDIRKLLEQSMAPKPLERTMGALDILARTINVQLSHRKQWVPDAIQVIRTPGVEAFPSLGRLTIVGCMTPAVVKVAGHDIRRERSTFTIIKALDGDRDITIDSLHKKKEAVVVAVRGVELQK